MPGTTSPTLTSAPNPSPSSNSQPVEKGSPPSAPNSNKGSLAKIREERAANMLPPRTGLPPVPPSPQLGPMQPLQNHVTVTSPAKTSEDKNKKKIIIRKNPQEPMRMLIMNDNDPSYRHIHQRMADAAKYRKLNQLKRSYQYYDNCMNAYDYGIAQLESPNFEVFCNRYAALLAQGSYPQAMKENMTAKRHCSEKTVKIINRGYNSIRIGLDLFSNEDQKLPYQKSDEIDAYKIVEGAVVESLRVAPENHFYLDLAYLAFILMPECANKIEFFQFLVIAEMFNKTEVARLCKSDEMQTENLTKEKVVKIVSALASQLFKNPDALKTEAEMTETTSVVCTC